MKEQIKEMAKVTMKHCKIDNQCGSCEYETCNECLAEALYNAGYRKQVDGEWIDKATMIRTPSAINYTCSVCGCESARTTPYCPNCGAKMKGGAE